MNGRRVLAFVVAALMVGGSLWWRYLDDEGGGGDDGPAGDDIAARVVCATELASVCEALGGDVEDAGVTAARLATARDVDVGAWVVPAAWPAIVDGRRTRAQLPAVFADPGPPVGRARLGLVVWNDRAAALGSVCPEVTWRCVGEAVAKGWAAYGHPEWGDVKPAFADPSRSATGLLVLGHAVTSYFGRADLATIDLEADDGFDAWFTGLARAVEPAEAPLQRMLSFGPAAYDVVGTTEAEAAIVARAAARDRVRLLYPAPMATAEVVVVGSAAGRVRDDAAAALRDAGWTAPAGGRLPSAGFLDALLSRWEQLR